MPQKILLSVLLVFLGGIIPGYAASKTYYYSSVTAQANTGEGTVYVSESSTAPSASEYKESYTHTVKSESTPTDVFLYALPAKDGNIFKYWLDADSNQVTSTYITVTGSESEGSPSKYSYTAVFGEAAPVTVISENLTLGTASIDKIDNTIGDEVVITAALAEPWAGGMGSRKWSKSHTFDGWYDKDGNLVSTETKYKFTITEPNTYTARFKWTPFVTGPGYYRVRWSYAEQFWALRGSYDPTPLMSLSGDSRKLNGVLDLTVNGHHSDPSTIMKLSASSFNMIDSYKEEVTVAKGLVLESQGVSTSTVLSKYTLNLNTTHNVGFYKIMSGSVQIASSEHGTTAEGYLYVNSDQTGKPGSDPDSYFEFEPVDLEHVDQFYFGAEPVQEMEYDSGYWTSMYTSFPYECYESDGVEAYYISEVGDYSGEHLAVLSKIESGVVPGYTAVLLKCKGLTAKENRLIPLMDDVEGITDNLLKGEFQLRKSKNDDGYVTYDSSTMRVFSVNGEGTLGFYKLAANADGTAQELVPNRAYLDISKLPNVANGPVRIVDSRYIDMSGIENVGVDANSGDDRIFDIYGRRVKEMTPGNIYIRNGRKILYK